VDGSPAEARDLTGDLRVFTLSCPEELEEGETYRVGLRRRGESKYSHWGRFIVATQQERESLEQERQSLRAYPPTVSDPVASDLVYASFLLEKEFYGDALRVAWQAQARQPRSPAVRHLLAWLFQEAGPPWMISFAAGGLE
jgi:hypothetical protein